MAAHPRYPSARTEPPKRRHRSRPDAPHLAGTRPPVPDLGLPSAALTSTSPLWAYRRRRSYWSRSSMSRSRFTASPTKSPSASRASSARHSPLSGALIPMSLTSSSAPSTMARKLSPSNRRSTSAEVASTGGPLVEAPEPQADRRTIAHAADLAIRQCVFEIGSASCRLGSGAGGDMDQIPYPGEGRGICEVCPGETIGRHLVP